MYRKTFTYTNTVTIYEPGDVVETKGSYRQTIPDGIYTVVSCVEPYDNTHDALVILRDENGNTKDEYGHRICEDSHMLRLVKDVKESEDSSDG